MPKLLGEFLQEQQEPFALDVYLLERGYSVKTSLDASSSARNYTRFLKRRSVPNCCRAVKAVFSRLVLHNNRRIKNSAVDNGEGREEHADEDIFSSASGSTVYNSCSESDVEDEQFISHEVDGEIKLKWRSMEDGNKQLSPISVLEETDQSDEASPLHQNQHNLKTIQSGESSASISSQCKSTHNASVQELVDSNSYAQYIINKRAMQQSKQLLIDCVREVIESYQRKDGKIGEQLKKILGTDELWKLVCENVWLWSQDTADEASILHLLHYDFMASKEEWSYAFDLQRKEISMEIGDAILEVIINEVLTN